jgi:hypothetical protein
MNLHPTDEQGTDDHIRQIISSRIIGIERLPSLDGTDDKQTDDFKNRVKIGDIVAILNGTSPIALVKVLGDWFEFDYDKNYNEQPQSKSIIWFSLRRVVQILCIKKDCDYIDNLSQFPMRTKSLTISSDKTTDTYKYIDEWYQHCKK